MRRSVFQALAGVAVAALFLVATQGLASARFRVFNELNLFVDPTQVCTDRITFILAEEETDPSQVDTTHEVRAIRSGGETVIPPQDLVIPRDPISDDGTETGVLPFSRQFTIRWSSPLAPGTGVALIFDDNVDQVEPVSVRACSTTRTADIDVLPNDPLNRVNPARQEDIPVAVLTTPGFDARRVQTGSVRFGRNGSEAAPVRTRLTDVDGDGDVDLLLRVRPAGSGIRCGNEEARVNGTTVDGARFDGTDLITTIKCQPK